MAKTINFQDGIYPNQNQFTISDVGGANAETKEIVFDGGTPSQTPTLLEAQNLNILRDNGYFAEVDSGTADAYKIVIDGQLQYNINLLCVLRIANANTGASTLTVNDGTSDLATKNIKKLDANGNYIDLTADDLTVGKMAFFQYQDDEDVMVLINPRVDTATLQSSITANANNIASNLNSISDLQDGELKTIISSGTNTYTATLSGLTAYTTGLKLLATMQNVNTGNSSLNINGLGAISILKGTRQVVANELSGTEMLIYDGANFQVIGKETASSLLTLLKTVDGSGSELDTDLVQGVDGNRMVQTVRLNSTQLNNATSLKSGIYTNGGDGLLAPDGTTTALTGWFHVFNSQHFNNNGFGGQLALSFSGGVENKLYIRTANGTTWRDWLEVWTSGSDGSGSGLTADTVRGVTFRETSGTLEYSIDSGTSWEEVGLPKFKKMSQVAGTSAVTDTTSDETFTIANITNTGKISRISIYGTNVTFVNFTYNIDNAGSTIYGTSTAPLGGGSSLLDILPNVYFDSSVIASVTVRKTAFSGSAAISYVVQYEHN